MANAYRDENSVPTLIASSNVDGKTPVRLWADPVTHRLLVDSSGGGSPIAVTDGTTTVSNVTTIDFTSGATVTNGGGGQANISISGGGGGGVTILNATGTVDGNNKNFIFSQLPNFIISDGAWYTQLDSDGNTQWTWNVGTSTATMVIPPQTYISGVVNSGTGNTGTVTSVSVVTANGLAGTVATATSTPAITLSTTVTGVLKGNGTAISAATSGTDYSAGTSALSTGIIKSTTGTGALTIAVAGDFPTLNQNTTGSAASFTGSLVGDVTGTQGATVVGKINGTSLAGLATGILKNTTGTGVPSIAVAADFPTLNQNTTGTAANVTGIVAPANGGTGIANNAAMTVTGSGNFAFTRTLTATTNVTFPTTGTLYGTATGSITSAQLATSLTDETGSGAAVFATSPALTTPNIGVATGTQLILTANAITATSNAATVPVTSGRNIVTNNSAATLTITLTTSGAVNMQTCLLQILDASAVAQTLTLVNTENSTVTAPTTTNGSTTLPLTIGFIFNSATTKWRVVATA